MILKMHAGRFFENQDGSIVVPFAVMLSIMLLLIGAGVDMGRAYSARVALQSAIDAGVLAAARHVGDDRIAVAKAVAKENFKTNDVPWTDPAITLNDDGAITATAELKLKTAFLTIIDMPDLAVSASATASASQSSTSEVTFTPTFVKGWFAKDIYAFVKDADGDIVQEVKVMSYDYNPKTQQKTVTPPLNTASQTYTLTGGSTFGMKIRVWQNDVDIGSRNGSPVEYESDSDSPNIVTSGDCATGQTSVWEDGGDTDFNDFAYTMVCKTMVGDISRVRLVK